jgi:hypothetical protein
MVVFGRLQRSFKNFGPWNQRKKPCKRNVENKIKDRIKNLLPSTLRKKIYLWTSLGSLVIFSSLPQSDTWTFDLGHGAVAQHKRPMRSKPDHNCKHEVRDLLVNRLLNSTSQPWGSEHSQELAYCRATPDANCPLFVNNSPTTAILSTPRAQKT